MGDSPSYVHLSVRVTQTLNAIDNAWTTLSVVKRQALRNTNIDALMMKVSDANCDCGPE